MESTPPEATASSMARPLHFHSIIIDFNFSQRLRDSAPRLAMRAPTKPAEINDHRNKQPQKIDPLSRHATVKFPCVYDRGERQENETEYGQHQTTVECALQVGREDPHQHERDPRKHEDDEQEKARHN